MQVTVKSDQTVTEWAREVVVSQESVQTQLGTFPMGLSVNIKGGPLCFPHLTAAVIRAGKEFLWGVAKYVEEEGFTNARYAGSSLANFLTYSQSSFIWGGGEETRDFVL